MSDRDENISIAELNLSIRAHKVLAKKKLLYVIDIINYGVDNIMYLPNAGSKTVNEIRQAIQMVLSSVALTINNSSKKLGQNQLPLFEEGKNEDVSAKIAGDNKKTVKGIIESEGLQAILSTSIAELNLDTRAFNVLKKKKIKTVKQLVELDLLALKKEKNVGRKTISNIIEAIKRLKSNTQKAPTKTVFSDDIADLLNTIKPKDLAIIHARYGYANGEARTLQNIGSEHGITRERVRQIIAREFDTRLWRHQSKSLNNIVENMERVLLNKSGIVAINDLLGDEYFSSGNSNMIFFIMGYLEGLYYDHYRIEEKIFIRNLRDNYFEKFKADIKAKAEAIVLPVGEEEFNAKLIDSLGRVSPHYLHYYIYEIVGVKKDSNNNIIIMLGKLSIPKRLKQLMRNLEQPTHYKDIFNLYMKKYESLITRANDLEHSVHQRLLDSGEFILTDPGTFILRENYDPQCNIELVIKETIKIMQSLSGYTDTKYLLKILKQHNVDTGNINAYSFKDILRSYPEFICYRKFEVGLSENTQQRIPLTEIMYDVLLKAKKPLASKALWLEVSKFRGFPQYIVEQYLYRNNSFIKMHDGKWAVREIYPDYEIKKEMIIKFAKKWLALKNEPVSAFFISESLKMAEKIKDITQDLVENVLMSEATFMQITNGYYLYKM